MATLNAKRCDWCGTELLHDTQREHIREGRCNVKPVEVSSEFCTDDYCSGDCKDVDECPGDAS